MFLRKSAAMRTAILVLSVLGGTGLSFSQTLPDTPAGKKASLYLAAFNSGEEKPMRDFFFSQMSPSSLQKRPMDERLAMVRQMREEMGTVEVRRVLDSQESTIRVSVLSKKGEWFEFSFECEPDPPHRLIGIRIETAGPAEESLPDIQIQTIEQLHMAVDGFVSDLAAKDEFSGVVLVARKDSVLFSKAWGLASREYDVPNRVDFRFNLGSINKVFTKIAVAELEREGRLSYEDRIVRFLPDYPNRDATQKVTVRHLLTMASGIGDFFGVRYDSTPKDRLKAIRDYLPLFADLPLAFEPGAKQQYSNGGYVVLGAIIEKASGMDYYDFIRDRVFRPAGMNDTGWFESDIPQLLMASGYTAEGSEPGKFRNNILTRPGRGSSAGGGYSTAVDLLKFSLALQNGKLQLPDLDTTTSKAGETPTFEGLGVAGGAPGINAILEVDPDTGMTIVVLSNLDPPSAEKVGKQIRRMLESLPAGR